MKDWMLVSIAFSLCSGLLKPILIAAGCEKAVKVLQTIFSIIMFSLAVGALAGGELPSVSFDNVDSDAYYRKLQEETLQEVFSTAEKELGTELCEVLKAKFGTEPRECAVSVDKETLALTDIKIFYAADGALISTYEIKNYIYAAYCVHAEVYWNE